MPKKKRYHRKVTKPDPNVPFISPLLRQDVETTANNPNVVFSLSLNQPHNKVVSDPDSGLFKEKASESVNRPQSFLYQRESELKEPKSNITFSFPVVQLNVNAPRTSNSSKIVETAIASEGSKVQVLSPKPTNELLEVPLKSSEGSAKKQDMIIEKSFPKLQVQSKLTDSSTENNQITKSNDEIKVEPDLIKKEPNLINSESSTESSSSEGEDEEMEVTTLNNSVIVLDDSEAEDMDVAETNNQSSIFEGEILLDDSEVDKMDLSQELEKKLQLKENLKDISRKQIFIGNLPSLMKKVHVAKFFERYGSIEDLKFIRSKSSKNIVCFLTYKHSKSALSALEANGLFYSGRNIHVASVGRRPVVVDSTIVVHNLPDRTTPQDLYGVFEICGLIKSQYLTKENGKLRGYITFELKISADYAVLIENFSIRGQALYIFKYTNEREKQGLSNLIS